MSDRDWFFFSTVGLALISGLVFAGSLNYSREREGHYQAAQEQYSGAYDRISESAPVRQSLIADIEAYRQEWREEQDLEAQRDMAKWAWLMMLASFAGVSITAVGVVFVAQTLVATREAVAAANRTADEAKRIGEAQVRAYLSVESISLRFQPLRNGVLVPVFKAILSNSGNSPAINVRYRYEAVYFFSGLHARYYGLPEMPYTKSGFDIPPHGEREKTRVSSTARVSADDWGKDWSGKLNAIITIHLIFTDVFGCDHEMNVSAWFENLGSGEYVDGTDTNETAWTFRRYEAESMRIRNQRQRQRQRPRLPGKADGKEDNGEAD